MQGILSSRIKAFVLLLSASNIVFNSSGQQPIPVAYSGNTHVNYIRTWDATAPINHPDTLLIRPLKDVRTTTGYFDGLTRPLQTVVKQGSISTGSSPTDLVSPVLYDVFGRESYKYLPYVSSNSDGNFKFNPFQQQDSFMNVQFGSQGQTYFYNQTVFESSALSRPLKSMSAGNSWVGASRGIESKYWINTVTDSVRVWTVTDVGNNFGSYTTTSSYAAGELFKNVMIDEHGKQIVEFKDKKGLVILKKVQLTASADTGTGKGYNGWLNTYYIYDRSNNLRCVIQPRGVELLLANSWNITALGNDILNEQCFRYEYDKRNRMSMKKVPGAGIVYLIYDNKDRLVMTQDTVMRAAHKWLYTEYDHLSRPIVTGLLTDNVNYNNAAYHRGIADTSAKYPNTGGYTVEVLTNTYYDNYDWRSSFGNPLSSTLDNAESSYWLAASNSTWPYPQAISQSTRLKGMVTGTRVKILGTASYLFTVNFYDEKGRLVQVQADNAGGGTDISTTQYGWTGQPLQVISKSTKANPNTQTSIVITKLTYDDLGRVVKTEKKASNTKVNSGSMPSVWTVVSENQYDALGQLKKHKFGKLKDAGGNYTANTIDSLVYDYNIRGWMLGANRAYAKDTNSVTNFFGFDLGYDKDTLLINGGNKFYTAKQYNGNIAGMLWKSTGDDRIRKYDFSYDAANRLTDANFTQLTNNVFNLNAGIDFSVKGISFDANGNILTMNQRGWKISGSETIDSLLYTYNSYSNKLKNVLDRRNDTVTRLGDFRSSTAYMASLSNNKTTAATDYTYDPNGNMNLDNNKNISAIFYNHLNLPDSIIITGKGSIKYVYDAAGSKLKKIVHETSKPDKTTLYIGGAVFENDTLQFLSQEEGRIRFKADNNSLHYDYFIKDHLGNVRMVLTDEVKTDAYIAATLEPATITAESAYYGNLSSMQYTKPAWFTDPVYTTNTKVAQVKNAAGVQKIGPNILLKVMAGDSYNIRVASGWNGGSATNSSTNVLTDLFSLLSSGLAGASGGKATTTELQAGSSGLNSALSNFLTTQTTSGSKPKAYINWILFDEQFKVVAGSSGFEQVGASGSATIHTRTGISVPKNGYLYIYTSNEATNIDVFFDNLQVTHYRGPLTEETHYYPFGLTMAGISSKALAFGNPENKKKFIGQLFDDDLGLNWYQFKYRNHDPQIGRFWQVDPLATKYVYNSTYAYAENKVGMGFDLEGLELQGFNDMFRAAGINVEQANKTTQAMATNFAKKAEPVINVTKDVITIAGGVTLLVASGGTAAPILVGLAGSATVTGGTMKLVFDISGNKEASDQIPTTLSGTAIFLTNSASEAATGKKLISDDVKTVAEFSEGVLTFKVSGFDKMTDVEKASTVLSGLSLTLDAVNPETAQAYQNLLGTVSGGGNAPAINLQDNKPKVDATYVKPPVILPEKKTNN